MQPFNLPRQFPFSKIGACSMYTCCCWLSAIFWIGTYFSLSRKILSCTLNPFVTIYFYLCRPISIVYCMSIGWIYCHNGEYFHMPAIWVLAISFSRNFMYPLLSVAPLTFSPLMWLSGFLWCYRFGMGFWRHVYLLPLEPYFFLNDLSPLYAGP